MGEKLGVSNTIILMKMEELGIEKRGVGGAHGTNDHSEKYAKILTDKDLVKNMSFGEIQKKYDIKTNAVFFFLRDNGIEYKKGKRNPR